MHRTRQHTDMVRYASTPRLGDRVVRIFDGAVGTVEQASTYDGRPLYGVRLDKDGDIWQGNDLAWRKVA